MFRTVRVSVVMCLTAALVSIPWTAAHAGETAGTLPTGQSSQSPGDGGIWRSALALVPTESPVMSQVVASTTESKLLVGIVAGSAIVAGAAMVAYGATSSCKGSFGNSTTGCDRLVTVGAVAMGAGAVTLALWAFGR